MRNPTHSGVPLLWWTWTLAPTLRPAPTVHVHVAEEHRPALIKAHAWQGRRGRRTARLHSCGLPVVKQTCHWHVCTFPAGAQVFALFPRGVCRGASGTPAFLLPALSHCTRQTAPGTSRHRQRVSDCSGGQACPLGMPLTFLDASDTGHEKQRFFFAFIPPESGHWYLRDFDSYLIMNHSFSCKEKRAHLMICPLSMS